jgi:hypothetical protein
MKLITQVFVIIALLCFSAVLSHKVHHKHKRHTHKHKRGFLGSLAKFALCAGKTLAGVDDGSIDQCLPAAWKNNNSSPAADDASGEAAASGNSSAMSQILGFLGTGLDLACKFKDKIVSFIKGKIGVRRWRRRLFLALSHGRFVKARRMVLKGFIGGAVDWVKDKAKAAGNAVVNTAKTVGNAIVDAASSAWNWIVDKFMTVVNWLRSIKDKLVAFMNSPLVQKVITFITCLKSLKTAAQTLIRNVQGFINAVKSLLTGWSGVITVLANCICNYRSFGEAINRLVDAVKASGTDRWYKMGCFVGQLVKAVGECN